MTHALDRPIWTALTTAHAAFGEGDGRARRFMPSISPFAATIDDTPESLASLAKLAAAGDMLVFLQADAVALPTGFPSPRIAEAVQMVGQEAVDVADNPRIERLDATDAEAMLDLARLANPGPFTVRALDLGRFWGIRNGDRLVAMAGERLRQPGYVEVSGVCTHPDARGQGLARMLSMHVASEIRSRGDVPYLHAYATNLAAIRLYEAIGFRVRSTMHAATAGPRD